MRIASLSDSSCQFLCSLSLSCFHHDSQGQVDIEPLLKLIRQSQQFSRGTDMFFMLSEKKKEEEVRNVFGFLSCLFHAFFNGYATLMDLNTVSNDLFSKKSSLL